MHMSRTNGDTLNGTFNNAVQYQARLEPSKSMDDGGRAILKGAVGGFLVAAFGTAAADLWPITIPLVLVAGGLVEAQRRIQVKQNQFEILTLDCNSLKIERFKNSESQPLVTEISPFMARVEAQQDRFDNTQRVLVKSGGKAYEVGSFLAPVTKAALAQTLGRELSQWSAVCPA